VKLLAGNVQELAPLVDVGLLVCGALDRLIAVDLAVGCGLAGGGGAVDELQDERSSGDDTCSSR
jgi:hypothetical protein